MLYGVEVCLQKSNRSREVELVMEQNVLEWGSRRLTLHQYRGVWLEDECGDVSLVMNGEGGSGS